MKFRKWESQIWMLIVFAVTLIIAVWVLWILSYFYTKTLSNKKYVSILWNIHSSLDELQALWICETSATAHIKYDIMKDSYKIICSDELWYDFSKLWQIDIISWCASSDTTCEYKIRK